MDDKYKVQYRANPYSDAWSNVHFWKTKELAVSEALFINRRYGWDKARAVETTLEDKLAHGAPGHAQCKVCGS